MSRFLLTFLAGVLVGAAGMWYLLEGPPGRHAAVGHWRGPLVDVRLEPDGEGRFNTLDLTWSEVDADTVALRHVEKGDGVVMHFELQDDGRAILKVPLMPVTLPRVADADE